MKIDYDAFSMWTKSVYANYFIRYLEPLPSGRTSSGYAVGLALLGLFKSDCDMAPCDAVDYLVSKGYI